MKKYRFRLFYPIFSPENGGNLTVFDGVSVESNV
jgi:hypothetical protein